MALSKVSSAGGTPQPLTTLDKQAGEITQRWPQVLPGGKAVLFTSSTHQDNYEDADIVVYSMASGQRKTVQRGGFYARYLPSGHVVYMHEGTLFAVPFDLKRLEVTGQPAPILEGVVTTPTRAGRSSPFPRPETSCMSRVARRSERLHLLDGPRGQIHAPPRDSRQLLQSRVLPRREAFGPGNL